MLVTDPLAQVAALPGVAEAVTDARTAIDRLLAHRVLRRRSAEVSAESALRGARASAALEGSPVPLDDVRSGVVADPVVQGALRVSAEIGAMAETWRQAPRQVLARLHALAVADTVGADRLGRPRTAAERDVHSPLELGPPPGAVAARVRLDGLIELLTGQTGAPALVVGAIVHAELLALRPFGRGDGIVARAAQRVTFIERGLDPKSLAAPEVGHVELEDAYAAALRGYVTGTPAGVAVWIRHCADAVSAAARDSIAVCEALQRG
jgi:Fic family protein